jgi:hypothetical protein
MSREAAESLRFMPCVHEATASNEAPQGIGTVGFGENP